MTVTKRQTNLALLLLFGINFMNIYDRTVVGAIGEKIKAEWLLSDAQLAGLTTAFILLYAIVGIPLGRVADVGSRKRVLAMSVVVWSIFTGLSGVAGSFTAMIAYRLGVGVGEAGAAPASNSLIGDLFPPSKRAHAIGVFMLGVPFGIGASFLISGLVVQWTGGWRPALFVAAVPGLILGALALTLPEPARGASDPDVVNRTMSAVDSIKSVLRTPTMWWIIASGALFNLNMYAINSFHTSFLIRFHGLNIDVANRFGGVIFGIGGGLGMFGGGWLADRAAKRGPRARMQLSVVALLITAPILAIAMSRPRGDYWMFASLMFIGIATMYMYYSSTYATIADIVPPQLRGMAMSVYFFVFYVFTAIGLFGFGKFSDARAAAAVARGATAVDSRAYGLHDALSTVPVICICVAIVLWIGSRSVERDHARVRANV